MALTQVVAAAGAGLVSVKTLLQRAEPVLQVLGMSDRIPPLHYLSACMSHVTSPHQWQQF